jgi:hypothetical protein
MSQKRSKMNRLFLFTSLSVTMVLLFSAQSLNPIKMTPRPVCQFFPANKLKFPVRFNDVGYNITAFQFRRILEVIQNTYEPLFRQRGLEPLRIFPLWENADVDAYAIPLLPRRDPNIAPELPQVQAPVRAIAMFGGLARHPLMTAEGLLMVACHEVGHHLGGAPVYTESGNSTWASSEGQADYFAASKCMRKVLSQVGNNEEWAQKTPVDFEVRKRCIASFPQSFKQAAICMRTAMAGLTLGKVLASANLSENPRLLSFRTPDRRISPVTIEGYPETVQCRVDTYFAGSVCRVSESIPNSNDPRRGTCHLGSFTKQGARPPCWYRDPFVSL